MLALGFKRSLLESGDPAVFESVCEYCGLKIVGTACDLLIKGEAEHRQECHPKAARQPLTTKQADSPVKNAASHGNSEII
jgi:hypothetical protein